MMKSFLLSSFQAVPWLAMIDITDGFLRPFSRVIDPLPKGQGVLPPFIHQGLSSFPFRLLSSLRLISIPLGTIGVLCTSLHCFRKRGILLQWAWQSFYFSPDGNGEENLPQFNWCVPCHDLTGIAFPVSPFPQGHQFWALFGNQYHFLWPGGSSPLGFWSTRFTYFFKGSVFPAPPTCGFRSDLFPPGRAFLF